MVVGGCGSGRTTLLRRLEELLGSESEYHDIERVATTPEAFLASVTKRPASTRRHRMHRLAPPWRHARRSFEPVISSHTRARIMVQESHSCSTKFLK